MGGVGPFFAGRVEPHAPNLPCRRREVLEDVSLAEATVSATCGWSAFGMTIWLAFEMEKRARSNAS